MCHCTFDPDIEPEHIEPLPMHVMQVDTLRFPMADHTPKTHRIDSPQTMVGKTVHLPTGYCRWGSGKNVLLLCYYGNRKCSNDRQICRRKNDQCTCQYLPYKEGELAVMDSADRPPPPPKHEHPTIPSDKAFDLAYPNGFCTMSGGKAPRLRCYSQKRICSSLLQVCQYLRQPCICQYNPYQREEAAKKQLAIAPPKHASAGDHMNDLSRRATQEPAYLNGYCRLRTGNFAGLMCHYKLRRCSYKDNICHEYREPCTCDFNPYESPSSGYQRKFLARQGLSHARPKTPTKELDIRKRKTESQGRPRLTWAVRYCDFTQDNNAGLFCFQDRRQCSFTSGVCRTQGDLCTCDFDPCHDKQSPVRS